MRPLGLLTVAAVLGALGVAPVQADPVLGVGITVWFSGGSSDAQTGLGLRLFSDDANESVVGSVGADYILQSGAIRPTLGIAYLQDDVYVGGDLGFDLSGGPLHYGLGFGATNTADPAAPVVVEPPVQEENPPVDDGPQCAVSCG